jgi:hypothetical protein
LWTLGASGIVRAMRRVDGRPLLAILLASCPAKDADTSLDATSAAPQTTAATSTGGDPAGPTTTTTTGAGPTTASPSDGSGAEATGPVGSSGGPVEGSSTVGDIDETGSTGTDRCAPRERVEKYNDFDMDGHGSPDMPAFVCPDEPGWVPLGDDCDDIDPAIHPDADETCDGLDNDCNRVIDEYDPDLGDASPCLDGPAAGCRRGAHAGHFYFLCVTPAWPEDILTACGAVLGPSGVGYAVSLGDMDEAAFFADEAAALGLPQLAIGLFDPVGVDQQVDYVWADLTPLTFPPALGLPPWRPGEPDEPVAQGVYADELGRWFDAPAAMSPFACEAEPQP